MIALPPGLPLNPKGTPGDFTDRAPIALKKGITRKGIYGVEQVLTWETAAVRRVDGIYIARSDAPSPTAPMRSGTAITLFRS